MATPMTASAKPIGKTQSTLIQCWPILIFGTTPAWGGNQSFRRTRSSAGLSFASMGSCGIAVGWMLVIRHSLPQRSTADPNDNGAGAQQFRYSGHRRVGDQWSLMTVKWTSTNHCSLVSVSAWAALLRFIHLLC